jgi:hypothetical protein
MESHSATKALTDHEWHGKLLCRHNILKAGHRRNTATSINISWTSFPTPNGCVPHGTESGMQRKSKNADRADARMRPLCDFLTRVYYQSSKSLFSVP